MASLLLMPGCYNANVSSLATPPQAVVQTTGAIPVAAGPGTKLLYTSEQRAAFGKEASLPLVILSSDDAKFLPADKEKAKGTIYSWMPKWMPGLSDRVLNILYEVITKKGFSAYPIDSSGLDIISPFSPPVAGIIIVPGSHGFGENNIRAFTDVNFPAGTISAKLLEEIRLFMAAHEAKHILLFATHGADQSKEYEAEGGAHDFRKKNPQFFRLLGDSAMAKGVIGGLRALNSFAPENDLDPDNHLAMASLDTDDANKQDLQFPERAKAAHDAVVLKIGFRLYEKKKFKASNDDAFMAGVYRAIHPQFYTLPEDGSHNKDMDVDYDKTGLLGRYTQMAQNKGFDIEHSLRLLIINLLPLFERDQDATKIAKARAFMTEYQINDKDLERFIEQAGPLAAGNSLAHEFRATYDTSVCLDPPACLSRRNIMEPSNPLLLALLEAASDLNSEGEFKQNREQQTFVDNLLAGAIFFRILPAERVQLNQPVSATPSPVLHR